ncbi:MAG: hypothetical protein AB1489_30430, partial [Acidobacteriota bacterium]
VSKITGKKANYSTNIKDAKTLIELLEKNGYKVTIWPPNTTHDDSYHIQLYLKIETGNGLKYVHSMVFEQGLEEARAITQFFAFVASQAHDYQKLSRAIKLWESRQGL